MNNKELYLRNLIKEVDESLNKSKRRFKELKKILAKEEDRLIGLRLSKDSLVEQLRKHMESLPLKQEQDQKNAETDREFRGKLPDLLKKV